MWDVGLGEGVGIRVGWNEEGSAYRQVTQPNS